MDDRATTVEIPTQLDRQDAFWYLFGLACTGLVAKWLADRGLPWPLVTVPVLAVGVWALTAEPATDVRYVGWLSVALRSRLGLRRADEWILARLHYTRLVEWPAGKARCALYWQSSRQRIQRWRALLSARTRWGASLASSWGSAIRFSWLALRAK